MKFYFFNASFLRIVKPQAQFVLILDLEGWGLKNFDSKVSTALAEIAKPYYPDYMGVRII